MRSDLLEGGHLRSAIWGARTPANWYSWKWEHLFTHILQCEHLRCSTLACVTRLRHTPRPGTNMNANSSMKRARPPGTCSSSWSLMPSDSCTDHVHLRLSCWCCHHRSGCCSGEQFGWCSGTILLLGIVVNNLAVVFWLVFWLVPWSVLCLMYTLVGNLVTIFFFRILVGDAVLWFLVWLLLWPVLWSYASVEKLGWQSGCSPGR